MSRGAEIIAVFADADTKAATVIEVVAAITRDAPKVVLAVSSGADEVAFLPLTDTPLGGDPCTHVLDVAEGRFEFRARASAAVTLMATTDDPSALSAWLTSDRGPPAA